MAVITMNCTVTIMYARTKAVPEIGNYKRPEYNGIVQLKELNTT